MSTASFAPYRDYVPASASWLGSIPKGWRVLRGKYAFREYSERSETGSEVLLSVSEYFGVKPRREAIDADEHLSRAESLVGYKKCAVNDLAMNIMLAWKKGLGVSKHEGIVSPAYSVFRFMKHACPDYMHYLLRTDLYADYFKARSTGIMDSRLRLYPDVFADVALLLPPEEEQTQIAKFLDYETAKIDALIEKQQQLIALVKEKRQAVISHAVTKGLNPAAPMRDSGVEWLGEVPAHWDVCRVKQATSFITSGPRGWSDLISEEGSDVFLQSGDLNDKLGLRLETAKRITPPRNAEGVRTKMLDGDVVVCITGANTGRVAVANRLGETVFVNQHLSLVRPVRERVHPTFLATILASSSVKSYFSVKQYGLKEGLSLTNVAEAPLCLPPASEQQAIVAHVTAIGKKMDRLEVVAVDQVAVLQERRTALISAAVTGKIDVRDWKAPESEAEVA